MRQISTKEALAKIMMGQDVKILIPGAVADDWTDYSPAYLSEYLDGVIFFADGANPEQKEQKEQQEEQKTEPAKAEEPADKKKRTPVDKGKILALHNAGWEVKKIADEMDCSAATVYRIINEQ
ncbi:MAG: helix-turn-helix domain-containing protein [Firmicutes bacterium]|nr:helix-turn-helix domain-containing protein [Bacillota bacterium]